MGQPNLHVTWISFSSCGVRGVLLSSISRSLLSHNRSAAHELGLFELRHVLFDVGAAVYLEPPRMVVVGCSLSRYLYTKYACGWKK